jgi:hypothetical protein
LQQALLVDQGSSSVVGVVLLPLPQYSLCKIYHHGTKDSYWLIWLISPKRHQEVQVRELPWTKQCLPRCNEGCGVAFPKQSTSQVVSLKRLFLIAVVFLKVSFQLGYIEVK